MTQSRLSMNQATVQGTPLPELAKICREHDISQVGLWREPVRDLGLRETASLLRDNGLTVSSLCRGGFFTTADPAQRRRALDDNRAAIDECVQLDTDVLVLVCGGIADGGLDEARHLVAEALDELTPYAAEAGVHLAIEPLHPMFCSDRCVISTLDQALDIAERSAHVGVVVDTYHVWWDPRVHDAISRAGNKILSFQVSDWCTPLPAGALLGRAMMGQGCIELRRLREEVDAAGYTGPIEVEIFDQRTWDRPAADVIAEVVASYVEHVE